MANFIQKIKRLKQAQPQGCLIVVGDDIESLSQVFIQQQSHLHVYQVIHDHTQQAMQIQQQQGNYTRIGLNLTHASMLKQLIKYIQNLGHVIELCVVQPTFCREMQHQALSSQQIQQQWQETGLRSVAVSQAVIQHMLVRQQGTVIFLVLQQQLLTNEDLLAHSLFASVRALSQSLAREFQAKGIHVASCMLEQWDGNNQMLMQSIQKMCWHVYQQPNSAWSLELSI